MGCNINFYSYYNYTPYFLRVYDIILDKMGI